MKLHICLLSAQLLANYLPIKLEKPDLVFFVSSAFTEKAGHTRQFEKMLKGLGINYVKASQLAPTDDFVQLREYFLNLIDEIEQLNASEITLNITGGTKLMAIAANEILKTKDTRVIYTNTQADKIEIIKDDDSHSVQLPSLLTINEYLEAYGVSPKSYNNQNQEWIDTVNSRKALTKQLVTYFDKDKKFLGTLNYCVQQALEKIPNSTQNILIEPQQKLSKLKATQCELLEKIESYGLIDFDKEQSCIYFKDVKASEYLGGFWLEEYAYFTAIDAGIEEVHCGQAIQWDKTTRNELDIILMHNNRLLIMECKTRNYDKNKEKDNDTIYKLDSVAEDLKGLYGAKWLLSMDSAKEETLKRAKSQGIKFITGNELKNLKDTILQWRK